MRLDKEEEIALSTEFPFTWGKKELKYLGIKITPLLKDLYQVNYIPLLHEIQVEFKKITNRTLSWMGRINVVKNGNIAENFIQVSNATCLSCIL